MPSGAEFRRVLMKLSRASKAARRGTQREATVTGQRDASDELELLGLWIALLTLVAKEGDSILDGLRPSTHIEIRPYLSDVNNLLTQAETVADGALLFYGGHLLSFPDSHAPDESAS